MDGSDPRMDKTAFSVVTLAESDDDLEYWLSKSPEERIAGVELMRQILYGYDPTTERLQRVLTIAQLDQS
jgi:hypothetical protein